MDGPERIQSPSRTTSETPNVRAEAVQDFPGSLSAASTQPPADLHTLGQHLRVSTDAGSFHRQLQQASLLRQQEVRELFVVEKLLL